MVTAADFGALITGSHSAVFRARVLTTFQTGDDPVGTDLLVVSGSIEFDSEAEIRGSGGVNVVGEWPRARNLELGPYGSEIYLARGVDRGAAGILWAGLGYYRITNTSQSDAAKGPLALDLEDRMATIIDSRFLQPRQWLQGTLVGDVIDEVVHEVYPDAVIFWDDDSNLAQLGRSLIVEESRYEVLQTMADGLGKIFYWDDIGRLVFITAPDEDIAVWEVKAGHGGAMVNADRSLSRDGVYNAVVVTGEGPDQLMPVRAVAYDAQESSPTFFGGPFGRVPRFYSSPFITTQAQATNAALNILARVLGAPYDVGLDALPNPAVRPYDVYRVVYDDGNREMHIVKRATIPLDVISTVKIATRQSTIVHVGVALCPRHQSTASSLRRLRRSLASHSRATSTARRRSWRSRSNKSSRPSRPDSLRSRHRVIAISPRRCSPRRVPSPRAHTPTFVRFASHSSEAVDSVVVRVPPWLRSHPRVVEAERVGTPSRSS
jgi:hypothetical protein